MGLLQQPGLLLAQRPALVEVTVRGHLESAAVNVPHDVGVALRVVAGNEEGRGDRLAIEQVQVAGDAAASRIASP